MSINQALAKYQQQTNTILTYLGAAPERLIAELYTQILDVDRQCAANMEHAHVKDKCSNCQLFSRIMDWRQQLEEPFAIEGGADVGKQWHITATEYVQPKLTWNARAAERARTYIKRYPEVLTCGTPEMNNLHCLQVDKFTLQLLTSMMINFVLKSQNIPNPALTYSGFICGTTGYLIGTHADVGTYDEIAPHTITTPLVHGIIVQLVSILQTLTAISFSHGRSSELDSMVFSSMPCAYLNGNLRVICDLTLHLRHFNHSTVTCSSEVLNQDAQVHIYTSSPSQESQVINLALVPRIESINVQTPEGEDHLSCSLTQITYFKLDNSNHKLLNYLRHAGYAMYAGTLDLYSFICALMARQSFRDLVLADHVLSTWWTGLWMPSEYAQVMARLDTASGLCLLSGLHLRCDSVTYSYLYFAN